MTSDERTARIERAGWNVLHLDAADIAFDLLTDVPARSFDARVRAASAEAAAGDVRDPDLVALAETIYGPARYVVSTKGRSAELALFAALGRSPMTIVTHGLFRSTQHALARYANAKLEIAPTSRPSGTADLDLAWLDTRLAAGGVDAVYLEPTNNALAGWPLSLENARAVQERCRRAGGLFLLDCPRLLSNVLRLGLPLSAAAEMCALADAFTVSCSKELLTPYGALVGVRDVALEHKVLAHCLDEGTTLEPLDARVRLAEGMRRILEDPAPLAQRQVLLDRLAAGLSKRGVAIVEPVGGHAVYLVAPPELAGADMLKMKAIESLLYVRTGIRAIWAPNPILKKTLMRLPLVVGRFTADEIDRVVDGLATFLGQMAEAPRLKPHAPGPNPMLARFALA